jgi:hypothetical protein
LGTEQPCHAVGLSAGKLSKLGKQIYAGGEVIKKDPMMRHRELILHIRGISHSVCRCFPVLGADASDMLCKSLGDKFNNCAFMQ